MKTLVLADNNLDYDNRIKRHVTTLLELGHDVTVLTRPVPTGVSKFRADGMRLEFVREPDHLLDSARVKVLARRTGLTDFVFRAFPGAFLGKASMEALGPTARQIIEQQIESSWWAAFQNAVFKEGVPPDEDYTSLVWYFGYQLELALKVLDYPADLIYCNDLPALLAGVAHKRRFNSRLVFDAHEIYYDMAPGIHTRLFKQAMALLEYHLAPCADSVIGVSESHCDWMRNTYLRARQVYYVPNCFGMGQDISAPPPRCAPTGPLRVYYHGSSDPWRGLVKMVQAIAMVPDTVLVLRCPPSESITEARTLAQKLGIAERVRFLEMVTPEHMLEAIRAEADVGIHAHELPTALNIKVALANKMIEYCMAGIPIITAPLEEQARIVRTHDLGYVLPNNSPEEIRRSFLWLEANRARLPEMGQRAYAAGMQRFTWPGIRRTLVRALSDSASPAYGPCAHPAKAA